MHGYGIFIFTAQLLKSKEIKSNKLQKCGSLQEGQEGNLPWRDFRQYSYQKNFGKVITERSRSWQRAEQVRESHEGTSQHHDKHQSFPWHHEKRKV